MVLGEPLLLKFAAGIIFKGVSSQSDLFSIPSPLQAGWASWSRLQPFPIGQLDGGHVSFALLGENREPSPVFSSVHSS